MKASARAIAAATAVAVAVTLPAHVLLILSGGMAALVLLVYIGIALPAVWSAKPTRRKAAADVLSRSLTPAPAGNTNESQPQSWHGEYVVRSSVPRQSTSRSPRSEPWSLGMDDRTHNLPVAPELRPANAGRSRSALSPIGVPFSPPPPDSHADGLYKTASPQAGIPQQEHRGCLAERSPNGHASLRDSVRPLTPTSMLSTASPIVASSSAAVLIPARFLTVLYKASGEQFVPSSKPR